jgi:hypothetical protein
LDKTEVRMRTLEAVAKNGSARDWNDIDNMIEKVKILSDFVLDQRTVSSLKRPELKQPLKQKA